MSRSIEVNPNGLPTFGEMIPTYSESQVNEYYLKLGTPTETKLPEPIILSDRSEYEMGKTRLEHLLTSFHQTIIWISHTERMISVTCLNPKNPLQQVEIQFFYSSPESFVVAIHSLTNIYVYSAEVDTNGKLSITNVISTFSTVSELLEVLSLNSELIDQQ